MLRKAFAFVALALLSVGTGCTMCCHPYDYCGPVFDADKSSSCNPRARVGSILSEGSSAELVPQPEVTRRQSPTKSTVARSTSNRSAFTRVTSSRTMPVAQNNVQTRTPVAQSRPVAQSNRSNVARKQQGAYGQTATFAVVNGQVQGVVTGKVQTGKVAGSEQILSVTERVVDPAPASESTPQVAENSSTDSAKPLNAQGWTARRPTP
jgi:hypothetical protein